MTTPGDSTDVEAQTPPTDKSRRETAEYGDSSSVYWQLYASEAEISDQKLVETLNSDTTAMSIVNGIFSSIIAGFIVQTSQSLQPDNGQETVCLLSQLVSPENSTQQSSQFCPGPYPGEPSPAAIRSNILLLISFFLAMISVLACGLIQQWCHEFMQYAYPRAAPHKRGRVRTYLFKGLNRFYIKRFMYGVHALLHISVFLFFGGLSDYLHDLYPKVGMVSWYCVITSTVAYIVLSVFPLFIGNCPYQTALSPPLLFGSTMLLLFCRTAWRRLCDGPGQRAWPQRKELHFDKSRYLVKQANEKAAHLDLYAMRWLFTDDDFNDADMDRFLQGLPGYINSQFTKAEELPEVLTAPYILQRIREHLLTCVTTTELSEQARVKRISACVDALRVTLPLRTSADGLKNPNEEDSLPVYIQSIVDDLNTLCDKPGEIRDLRACCVRALTFHGFLTKCLEPASQPTGEGSPEVKVPDHFIPLHTFFSSVINTSKEKPVPAGVSDKEEPSEKNPSEIEPSEKESSEREPPQTELSDGGKMWRDLLNDGPFINLTLLAKAILSQDIADHSSLSMCWKTLDLLRSEFRIDRADVSASPLKLFSEIHEETHIRVETEEPGFSVVPLLEILDAVDGGRRLSRVFQDQPNPKYRSKAADLVFGKDHLRNPDLFHAFAKCLPHFVTEHPDKSTEFMEGLVRCDHLWISLQVHLSNSLRPNSFTPVVLRVFDTCCTVIDTAFVALENSKVDWRAPNFGSLAHYFELFVTDCFQGMFIERAIAFRVGLIKARFCRAVLAQFLDEFKTEGTVIFRSHWDVAALARIFYSLGVSGDADVEFWKSFVDGGPVGVKLVAKTHTTLVTAKRDGPLLNFCKLGYLGLMAVPFKGSGLKDTDFKNLLALMQKMTEDSRLPLTDASAPVWEELDRLRDEVADTRTRIGVRVKDEVSDIFETSDNEDEVIKNLETSGNKDETYMKALLRRIDKVIRRRPLSTYLHRPSDHVTAQASGTSTIVQPNSPSRGPIPGHDRFSSTSTSTVISEDWRNSSPAQEVDLRGVTLLPFDNSRGVFANVYRNPYPHLPSQIGPGGTITRPFYASFLPNLFPHPGSTAIASPGIPTPQPPLPHVRYNSEHHLASVYYPPKLDNPNNDRSASLLSSRPPGVTARMLSTTSSNMWFGPTSNNVAHSNAPRTITLLIEEEIQ